jgi:hypothetical protein
VVTNTPTPLPAPPTLAVLWSQPLQSKPRGLVLAREKGWLLAWDDNPCLYLLNQKGQVQAQSRPATSIASACCADNGSGVVAAGSLGQLWWLAPDLSVRWERSLPARPVSAAVDPFGQYIAVSDVRGGLRIFDCYGRPIVETQSPRPFQHLTFVPGAPYLIGSADFGLVACLTLNGDWVWRDGLVIHVGAVAVTGSGDQIICACFTEGLQRYALPGEKLVPFSTVEPWRLVAVSFDGQRILVGGMSPKLHLLDSTGKTVQTFTLEAPPMAMAMDPLGRVGYVALPGNRVLAIDLNLPAKG